MKFVIDVYTEENNTFNFSQLFSWYEYLTHVSLFEPNLS